MVRIELASFYFRATATAPFFFSFSPQRRAPPFLVPASGAVALKVAQVPRTYLNKGNWVVNFLEPKI